MNEAVHYISTTLDFYSCLKIFIAAMIGVVVGLEREVRNKPTGIKTLIVISVSSALLTIISIKSVDIYSSLSSHVTMDPMRLPAQIVSGIGFIGAGVIWKRTNNVVQGLTTAAIVWGVAALSVAVGAGFITEALFALICILAGVEFIPRLIQRFTKVSLNKKVVTIRMSLHREQEINAILKNLKQLGIRPIHVKLNDDFSETTKLEIRGYMNAKQYITEIYSEIIKMENIKQIEINE